MCLGVPGQILRIDESPVGMTMGIVSFGGGAKEICLPFVPQAVRHRQRGARRQVGIARVRQRRLVRRAAVTLYVEDEAGPRAVAWTPGRACGRTSTVSGIRWSPQIESCSSATQ